MSQDLKIAESVHTDQHDAYVIYDANAIYPVVNSSDEAGRKNDKAGDNLHDESAKRISKNSSTNKQVK